MLCAASLLASPALAVDSLWAYSSGKILPNDSLVSCAYGLTPGATRFSVDAWLRQTSTNGAIVNNAYVNAATTLSVRMECRNNSTGLVSSPAEAIFTGSASKRTITCPVNSQGINIRCQLHSTDANPFTYAGSYLGGDPCANGIASITPLATDRVSFKGQVSGQAGGFGEPTSEMNFRSAAGDAVFNSSLMSNAKVYGTDMGFTFYSGGSLWSGYGDTWADRLWQDVAPTRKRGSVLFKTQDLNAADGLTLSAFESVTSAGVTFAKEVVPSCHNTTPCNEASAIATSGFGLNEGGVPIRILWFDAIETWVPTFKSKVASLAYSINGGEWKRADIDRPFVPRPPMWTNDSHFGAGATWHDRRGGFIYFFGQRPYMPNAPVRLARVAATFAAVMDEKQYWYWNGTDWIQNAADPLKPSRLTNSGLTSAADIIPASNNSGPEFSVSFDAYANRFIMLIVSNRETDSAATQLWQSNGLEGPWKRVATGQNHLPNANMTGGAWFGKYNFFYGPYTHETLMRNGGSSVYFQLSEWNQIPVTKPYNTGLWGFNVTRNTIPGCVQ